MAGAGAEPRYDGKTVHEWLQAVRAAPAQRPKAAAAFRKVGPAAKAAVPALLAALRERGEPIRSLAAQALGRIGAKAREAVPALLELLRDKNDSLRFDAAEALSRIGPGADAVPVLAKRLRDRYFAVGRTAAAALGKIGPAAKDAVPDLTKALKDRQLRGWAADALGRIGPAAGAAVPTLLRLLEGEDYGPYCRSMLRALGRIGDPKALPAARAALRDKAKGLRAEAARAIELLQPGAGNGGGNCGRSRGARSRASRE
jgi:HEAT repeat protein